MPYGYKGLAELAAKVQSAFGTVETTMDNTNLQACLLDQTVVQFKQTKTDMRLANTAFGVQKGVYGQGTVDVTAAFPLGVTGAVTEPHVSPWLKASGWKLTTATKKHTYQPSATYSDWKDMTVWGVTGDKEAGDAMITKAGNCMFGFSIKAGIGEPAIITFTGMGSPVALPAAGSQIGGTQTQPSDIYLPLISAGTVSIGGQTYKLVSYEMTWDAKPVIISSAAADFGVYRCTIGNDPRCTMKMTVVQENFSAITPWANSKTAGTLTLTYGATTDTKISITSGASKFVFDPPTISDSDGIQTLDIEGYFLDNDANLIINEA
jgi:hypothetical protein